MGDVPVHHPGALVEPEAYSTIIAVTIPNIPSGPSA